MVSPYLPQYWESDPQGKPMEVWVQERGKSEGFSVMEEIGVEPSGDITPRESGQTSTRSPLTREQGKPIKEAKQMTVTQTGAASHDIVVGWHEHSLANRSPQRASAPGAYCEGHEGRQMGQGESPATFADPLVQRQGACRATSDGKPGAKNARRGRRNLDHAQPESTSHPRIATKRVSSQTAETRVYPEKLREDAPPLDSLHEGPSHASLVPAGSGPHGRSDQ